MSPTATPSDSSSPADSAKRVLTVSDMRIRKAASTSPTDSQQTRQGQRKGAPTPWVNPPLNLSELQSAYNNSTWHKACVDAKRDAVIGYEIGLKPSLNLPKDKKPDEKQREIAMQFLAGASPDFPLEFVLKSALVDYENLGFCTLEIGRNRLTDLPERLFYMPAATTLIHRDQPLVRQTVGLNKREFPLFNAPDRVRGTNEVLRMMVPNFRSSYYGLPDHLSVIAAIIGDIYARNFNLNRFKSRMLTNWAIAFNGTIGDGTKQRIKDYFQEAIESGDVPEPLLLETGASGPDAGVVFQRLSDEIKDASFVVYRKCNREEISAVHRVPPNKITAFGDMKFQNAPEQAEQFRDEVTIPRQRLFEFHLNRVLVLLGVTDWVVSLPVSDLTEDVQEANRAVAVARTGVARVDEVRSILKLDPLGEDAGGNEFVQVSGGAAQEQNPATSTDPNAAQPPPPTTVVRKSRPGAGHELAAPVDRLRIFEHRIIKAIGQEKE